MEVLKGGMNSRKGFWKTQMYAADKKAALDVHRTLSNDGLIGQQTIYIRRFEKLKSYGDSVIGMPIAREFRFFVMDGEIISGGFYWINAWESADPMPSASEVPVSFLKEVVEKIGDKCRAFCLDVAEKESGEWCCIELNSIEQAGLSDNDAKVFYQSVIRRM